MSQTEIPESGIPQPEPVPRAAAPDSSSAGFWGSMPKVLTALGGLVTAVGTAAAVYFGGIKGDGHQTQANTNPVSPQNPVVMLVQPAAPAPTGVAVTGGNSRTSRALAGQPSGSDSSDADSIVAEWASTLDSGTAATANGCASGYADDCQDMVEILADECESGEPLSCDVLYLASPEGSALEEYGNTCGGRVSGNDEWCRDLAARS